MPKPKKPTGRPSTFTPETAAEICLRLSEGETLRAICRDKTMPDKATVMRWLGKDESFRDQYARAREAQADHWADEIMEIADDGAGDTWTDSNGNERVNADHIQRSRVRIDTRKWLMARMAPKKYGDKTIVTGEDGGPIRQAIEIHIVDDRPAPS